MHGADGAISSAEAFAAANLSRCDGRGATGDREEIEHLVAKARQHQGDAIEVLAGEILACSTGISRASYARMLHSTRAGSVQADIGERLCAYPDISRLVSCPWRVRCTQLWGISL